MFNTASTQTNKKARDLYFHQFDLAMGCADRKEGGQAFERHVSLMEQHGTDAGVAANEIAYRKQTLLYHLTQGFRQ